MCGGLLFLFVGVVGCVVVPAVAGVVEVVCGMFGNGWVTVFCLAVLACRLCPVL